MRTYLFVAGPFQDMQSPVMNMTRPCMNDEDGSSGNTRNKSAAKGTPEAELICDKIILPELGKRLARMSPIHPPKRPPREPAITKRVMRNAVVSWEKPMSSSHIGANDKADQMIQRHLEPRLFGMTEYS